VKDLETVGREAPCLIERALGLGCSQAEVFSSAAATAPVSFENNRLKSVNTAETTLTAVRVIKDGRVGFATSTKPGDLEVVDLAARAAAFGPEADLDFAGRAPVRRDLQGFDPAVADWPLEAMVERGSELVEELKGLAEGLLVSVDVEREISARRVTTSNGQDVAETGTAAVGVVMVQLVEGENIIWLFDFDASRRLAVDFPRLAQRVRWLFGHARRNTSLPTGKYPVLFSPTAAADLIAPMEACLSGRAVVKGESPWKDRLGSRLLAEGFTLLDDPTLPWGLGTTPFDDEGVPTGRRTLIDHGVLKDFYLDLRSARTLGRPSTGNGFRRGQSPPNPGPSNLVVEPGEAPWSSLVTGIKRGLLVTRLMGAWAGNPYSGQVSGNVDVGFRIEDGEITGRVKDCMLSVDVFAAFRDHLLALSREVETTPAMSRLPYILLDEVSVSARS